MGQKFCKTLMFLGQAGMFLPFQAKRSSATRSSDVRSYCMSLDVEMDSLNLRLQSNQTYDDLCAEMLLPVTFLLRKVVSWQVPFLQCISESFFLNFDQTSSWDF